LKECVTCKSLSQAEVRYVGASGEGPSLGTAKAAAHRRPDARVGSRMSAPSYDLDVGFGFAETRELVAQGAME